VAVAATLGSAESVAALALAHVAAGGEVPSAWWLFVFAGLVYGAGTLVLRHRASIRVVLPVLLAAQLLGHGWLVALGSTAHPGHEHTAATVLGLGPAMLAAHAVAAAVTGAMWALRRRAVEVLLEWSEPGVVPVPGPRRTFTAAPRREPAAAAYRDVAPTRGPPEAAFAIA